MWGHLSSVLGHRSSVIRHPSSVIGPPSSVIRPRSSVIGHPSSVICHYPACPFHEDGGGGEPRFGIDDLGDAVGDGAHADGAAHQEVGRAGENVAGGAEAQDGRLGQGPGGAWT